MKQAVVAYRPGVKATPLHVLDRQLTPADVFFERSHHGVPVTCAPLAVDGRVLDLSRYEEVSITAVLQCAGNGRALFEPPVEGLAWTHGGIGQATWTGVRLRDVLREVGDVRAAHVWFAGADQAYRCSLPRARALDPSTLLAYCMNGAPLREQHGAPLRLVVPGWSGNTWMKWVERVTFADAPFVDGAYQIDGVPLAAFPVKSLIANPSDGAELAPGSHEITGVAFSGAHAIARVEIGIDGVWSDAVLDRESAPGRWTVFRLRTELSAGRYRITARATDTSGAVQPEVAAWNPGGYHHDACHKILIEVKL